MVVLCLFFSRNGLKTGTFALVAVFKSFLSVPQQWRYFQFLRLQAFLALVKWQSDRW